MIEDEISRCAKMLESVVRMHGLSARQLEDKLGYGAGTVNRLFNGKIELKVRHILLILGVIGIPPSQFFREAFPEDERPRTEPEVAARLLDLLERHAPKRPAPTKAAAAPPAPGISDEDLERRILEALNRLGVAPPATGGRKK
ncbi:MAG TPA: hypothetical protein DD490_06800 [Acidobacteria bacterium]|nr:hypothetical protein [Acidobacteriota bacterium]